MVIEKKLEEEVITTEEVIVCVDDTPSDKVYAELEMDVFATGTWNNDKFSDADLDEIIKSHNAIGAQVKPYLKLGHNEEQELAKKSGFFKDGKPALGWMESLVKQGNKLVATFKDVPAIIADLVNRKAYKRVSCELFENYAREGVTYPWALKAVALLGADTPAVTTLQDVAALYSESEGAFRTIEFSENFEEEIPHEENTEGSEVNMTVEKPVVDKTAELEKKFAEEKQDIEKKYTDEIEALKSEVTGQATVVAKYEELGNMFEGIEDMKKAVLDFQAQQKEVAATKVTYDATLSKARKDEVSLFVDTLVKENRILPFQQKMAEEILFNLPETEATLEFTQSDLYGLKEQMTLSETVRALLKSNPDMGMLKEFTSQEATASNPDVLRAELEKKYMDENEVTYGEAQIAVSKARPDLYSK